MREKLKDIRIKRGMTQQEAADAANIARVTYTNIELGNKNPSFPVATRIKKAMEYYDDDIFLVVNVPKVNNVTAGT